MHASMASRDTTPSASYLQDQIPILDPGMIMEGAGAGKDKDILQETILVRTAKFCLRICQNQKDRQTVLESTRQLQ